MGRKKLDNFYATAHGILADAIIMTPRKETNVGTYDPIAYTYDADYHCPACTEERFGRSERGFIAEDSEDSEGNPVGILSPWDEWWQETSECDVLGCSDCHGTIDTVHAVTPYCTLSGEYKDDDDITHRLERNE
jgi:hypothetical protein